MSGLTDAGFELKTLEEIQTEIEDDELQIIDPALDVSAEQPVGQINGIAAKKLAEIWELLQTFANAMNPNSAENFLLDNICALTGTTRIAATKSTVAVDCTVGAGFTATAGQILINVSGSPDVQFTNVDAIPSQTAGTHSFQFQCTVTGPVAAPSGTLTVITTPVSGLSAVTNPLDAIEGTQVEQDGDLRVRRQVELTAPGACTVDSIRSDILAVKGVKQCYVFENVTLDTDSNGLPGKSIEVVVYDGLVPAAADTDIAQVVWDSKPSGSETFGSTTVSTIRDSTGVLRSVNFSRATVENVWFEFDVEVDSNFFPSNGVDLIKSACANYGQQALNLGRDVFANAFKGQAMSIPGVLDVTALRLGFSSSPVGMANLTITGRQIADVDTSRMIVNVTPGTP